MPDYLVEELPEEESLVYEILKLGLKQLKIEKAIERYKKGGVSLAKLGVLSKVFSVYPALTIAEIVYPLHNFRNIFYIPLNLNPNIMNAKILDEWAELIGHERAKLVADVFFDKKIDLDFPNLAQGDLTHIKKSIIAELEDVGSILLELDGNILSYGEIIKMVDLLARDLISKSLPDAFVKDISAMLLAEERLGKELDDEIRYIKGVLNSIQRREEELE